MFFGNLFLICAVLCAFLQAAPLLRREWRSQKFFQLIASRSAVLQFFFVVSAFALLVYGFVSLDFSIELVARHANNKMPMLYRLTAVWGNHEGSFLLWTMGIALFGAAFASVRLRMDEELKATALAFQGLAGIIFYWFIIFFSNPFQSAFEAIPNSGGLNPLLQDMGLIWHPPLLYMGHEDIRTHGRDPRAQSLSAFPVNNAAKANA
jgi:cytochrome c-type biogenesis protein CcmF